MGTTASVCRPLTLLKEASFRGSSSSPTVDRGLVEGVGSAGSVDTVFSDLGSGVVSVPKSLESDQVRFGIRAGASAELEVNLV